MGLINSVVILMGRVYSDSFLAAFLAAALAAFSAASLCITKELGLLGGVKS